VMWVDTLVHSDVGGYIGT